VRCSTTGELVVAEVPAPPSLRHRIAAYIWFAWGLSLCYRGNRLHNREFYRAGIASFGRAVQLWPGFAPAFYRRGLIRGRELGEYQAAIADLDQASRLRPEWPEPYLQRGLFHRFNGAPQVAFQELSRYLDLAPPGYWRDEAARQLSLLQHDPTFDPTSPEIG
jgi:tetratricopeptide (TPR) repeat protein